MTRRSAALTVAALTYAVLAPTPSAAAASVDRILLNPTSDPSTSQFVSWSRAKPRAGQFVVTVAPDGSVRRTAARRKVGTSKRSAGRSQARYVARLDRLLPATAYRYRIVSGATTTRWRTFRTAGTAGSSFTFLQFGDTQIDNARIPARIIRRATRRYPDARLLLQAGDVVNHPWERREWDQLHRALSPSGQRRSVMAAIGNHEQCVLVRECRSGAARGFRSYFHAPSNGHPRQRRTWYHVDQGPARFIVLDSFGGDLRRQRAFLADSLRTNPRTWSIVLMHQGPFAARGGRDGATMRRWFLRPLEKYGADLVLTGHDHSYARATKSGVTYLTSVSGPKYYDTSAADFRRNGAKRRAWASGTSTYQAITVSRDAIAVRSIVAHRARGAKPAARVGDVLDSFTLRR